MPAILLVSTTVAHAQSNVLSVGHTDIAVNYENNIWNLNIGYDVTGEEFPAASVLLRVNPLAQTVVPNNPAFSFLGTAGSPVWILPQAEDPNLLFLGYGADGLPDGAFVGNQVQVTLRGITGPGQFAEFELDSFGNPIVFMNTRDGISAADHFDLTAGGDAHTAWAFSQPGRYTISLDASGTLANGNVFTASGPVEFSFEVVPEPKIWGLLGLGSILVILARRRLTSG
jgi:surface-anchored protein